MEVQMTKKNSCKRNLQDDSCGILFWWC